MEHMGGGSRLMAERQVICQGRLLSLKNKCWQRVIGSKQRGSFQSTEAMPTDSSQLLIMASPLGP